MRAGTACLLLLVNLFLAIVDSGYTQDPPKPGKNQPDLPKNLDLEQGELGQVPSDWVFPPVCAEAGYKLALSEEKPFAGRRCAVLSRREGTEAFGNVLQFVDATGYRGKRVRFRAAVRADVAGSGNQAMLWMRVDNPNGTGFFDNMSDRPITSKEWKHYEIVGDIADDAQSIVFGMMLLGNGSAALDDVSFEIVDKSTVRSTGLVPPSPGLMEVVMAATVNAGDKATELTYVYPLPLAYRDQAPLTYRLTVDPPAAAKSLEIVEGAGENRLVKLTLQDLAKHKKIKVEYRSLVLVGPTSFDKVPVTAPFPKEWPTEAQPWLASTWCVDFSNERVKKLTAEIRGDSDDVMAVIRSTLDRARHVYADAKGRVNNLTSVEALDKQGSCTSCANLVAALLRGAGIPARVLSGYPLWSGPLQTHYVVEAWVPGYGWYPVESTRCQSPWPNYQQVNVSIIPPDHESQAKAGLRRTAAGGVPFQSLTECEGPNQNVWSMGTIKPYCDHECRLVQAMSAKDAEWSAALNWAKQRWAGWLKSEHKLENGKLLFGPSSDQVKATSPAELQKLLK
jgi:hypothetical protein